MDAKNGKPSQLNLKINSKLHRDAKEALARKGKTFKQVVEKALVKEVGK